MMRFLLLVFGIPIVAGVAIALSCHGSQKICGQAGAGATFIIGMIGFGIFVLTDSPDEPEIKQ